MGLYAAVPGSKLVYVAGASRRSRYNSMKSLIYKLEDEPNEEIHTYNPPIICTPNS